MIYLCNSEGVIVASVPSAVNQGSVGVNEIVLIAPFPASCAVSLALTLPNGVLVYPQAFPPASSDYLYNMTLAESFKGQLPGNYNVWTMKLDKALTQVAGTARISFFITDPESNTLATPSTTFNINKSAGYILDLSDADITALNSYIGVVEGIKDEAERYRNEAERSRNEALGALAGFHRENYFDVAISDTTFPVGMPEDVIQAELQKLLFEASGNVLVKDLTIIGVSQPKYTKGEKTLSVPSGGTGYSLIIPRDVNRIVFSNCTFKRVALIGDYNEMIEGQYVIDNTTEIQILPPLVDGQYITENVVALFLFGSVRNSVADNIIQCFNVDNCIVRREVTECINVTNCSGFHFITGTGTQVLGATIRNCQYVDLYSLFAMDFANSGGATANLDGMVMTLRNGTTESRIRPLPQGIAGSIAASTLTLELKDKNGNTISSASVALPLSSIYRYGGSVATFEDLPANSQVGDVYNVESAYGNYPAGTNFAWNGTTWDALGGIVDLSGYLTRTEFNATIGDISTALDDIISIQESLIGGNNV